MNSPAYLFNLNSTWAQLTLASPKQVDVIEADLWNTNYYTSNEIDIIKTLEIKNLILFTLLAYQFCDYKVMH